MMPPAVLIRHSRQPIFSVMNYMKTALLPTAHFATVYAKPAGRPTVDSFITEVSQDTWILFPWDQEAVMAKTIVEMKGAQ